MLRCCFRPDADRAAQEAEAIGDGLRRSQSEPAGGKAQPSLQPQLSKKQRVSRTASFPHKATTTAAQASRWRALHPRGEMMRLIRSNRAGVR